MDNNLSEVDSIRSRGGWGSHCRLAQRAAMTTTPSPRERLPGEIGGWNIGTHIPLE